MDLGDGQRALWCTNEVKQGECIGDQGYWGTFATRKPDGDEKTVRCGLQVKDHNGKMRDLMLVGDARYAFTTTAPFDKNDVRCALTVVNACDHGVPKENEIKPNVKIMGGDDYDMMRRGNRCDSPSVCYSSLRRLQFSAL